MDRLRLEDVASGYWTLSIKQSSGPVSHYGSSPSSSARRSTIDLAGRINLFDRRRTDWHHQPRMTTGAFVFARCPRFRVAQASKPGHSPDYNLTPPPSLPRLCLWKCRFNPKKKPGWRKSPVKGASTPTNWRSK
jgi:hypothetical protein